MHRLLSLILMPLYLVRIARLCRLVWRLSFDKRVPLLLRSLVPLALLYLVLPIDLVRDSIPILGRVDDLLGLVIAVGLLVVLSPAHVVEELSGRGSRTPASVESPGPNVVEGSARIVDD